MKPLEGIRIIACEHFIVEPMCTMMLGDIGADVIKAELESAYYLSFNRSKRSIILDLGTPEGVNIRRSRSRVLMWW
jgi:crotonobetainyl-CoA:carnitine CoA-transferase CaiB-like acyl-CoA transferase